MSLVIVVRCSGTFLKMMLYLLALGRIISYMVLDEITRSA